MRARWMGLALAGLLWAGPALSSVCQTTPMPILPDSLPVAEWRQTERPVAGGCLDALAFVARQRAQQQAQTALGSAPSASTSAAGYVPKTKDDNTPWRFDMNQNGKRMTADQFDTWMKAKGIRVATGKAVAPAAATPATTPVGSATVNCPAGEGVTC